MTRQLDHVLTRVRAGRAHDRTERVVQPLAVVGIDDDDVTLHV
jgi:hypothetical protein